MDSNMNEEIRSFYQSTVFFRWSFPLRWSIFICVLGGA